MAHSLIFSERPERIAYSRSFVLSDLSESLTVAHLIWAKWANERIPSPALLLNFIKFWNIWLFGVVGSAGYYKQFKRFFFLKHPFLNRLQLSSSGSEKYEIWTFYKKMEIDKDIPVFNPFFTYIYRENHPTFVSSVLVQDFIFSFANSVMLLCKFL